MENADAKGPLAALGRALAAVKEFAISTFGSQDKLDSLRLIDLKGQLPYTGESVSLLGYLPQDTVVVLWAPLEIAEQAKSYFDRLPEVKGVYPLNALLRQADRFTRVELSQFGEGAAMVAHPVVFQARRDLFDGAQRVIPERLYLNRRPGARRHHIVAELGVHPR